MLQINQKTFHFSEIQKQCENNPSPLQEQLNRLHTTLNIISMDKPFVHGYIFKDLHPMTVQNGKDLLNVIDLLFELKLCDMIDKQIFVQFIVVLSHVCSNLQKYKIKNILSFYQHCVNQIINDQEYFSKKYFKKEQNKSKINKSSKINESKSKGQNSLLRMMNQNQMMQRSKSNLAECPICVTQITHEDISVLACGHIIHKQCFNLCMKQLILNKKFPLKCPFQECLRSIETQDIQEYLPKQLVEKYYQFTIHNFVDKNAKNMAWCPTPGCSNAFQFDQHVSNYKCPQCKKNYCLKCKTQMHDGITCEQNKQMNNMSEEDKKFMEFVKGSRYKQCPKCKFWVQKSQGCCHMTCRCGYQFCYNCGAQYGQCNCQQQFPDYYGSGDDDDDDDQDDENNYNDDYNSDPDHSFQHDRDDEDEDSSQIRDQRQQGYNQKMQIEK